jgi:hypothetical protein
VSVPAPLDWTHGLRSYQQENARWLVELDSSLRARVLTDGLGTGKTFSALGAMRLRWESGLIEYPTMLCFTTASSAFDWKRAANAYWPEMDVYVIGAGAKSRRKNESDAEFADRQHPWKKLLAPRTMPDKPVLIVGDYWWADVVGELAMKTHDVLLDSVTLDEAHNVKKAQTARSKFIRMLVARSRQTTMMTGTPVHNRPVDLHNLLSLCNPSTPGYWTWVRKYFHIKLSDRNYEVVAGLKDKAKLMREIEHEVKGRTAAELMGDDLPARNYQLKLVEVEGAVRVSPQKLHAKKTEAVEELLRSMVRHKLESAVDIARDADKPIVIYAYRREDAAKLVAMLSKAKLTATLATGDLSPTKRDAEIQKWKDGASQCLVCTMDAVRESATLVRADLMLFVDLHTLPAVVLQNMGRIDPARQPENERRPVTYQFLVVRNGPDEVLAEMLVEKIREASGIGVKNANADKFGEFLAPLGKKGAQEVLEKLSPDAMMGELVERIVARENRLMDLDIL